MISCVMTTYRRFTCVERSISFFLNQDFGGEKELIIFNTDTEHPLVLGAELLNENIRIINNNTDYKSSLDYSDIGAIRRDAITHALGEYYICWDDDDIFLPWNIRQCFDGISSNNCMVWKPRTSMYWPYNSMPELARNAMEASAIVNIKFLRSIGFDNHAGGGEHLKWLLFARDNGLLIEDENSIPAYCFNWNDTGVMRGHKQSGSINRLDNFQFHKQQTTDFATRELKLFPSTEINEIYNKHKSLILSTYGAENFYVKKYIGEFN